MLYEIQRDKLAKDLVDQKMLTQKKADDYANLTTDISSNNFTINQQNNQLAKYEGIIKDIPNNAKTIW